MPSPQVLPGIHWPLFELGPDLPLKNLMAQLERLERASPATLRAGQEQQLRELGRHFAEHCPFHCARLRDAGLDPAQPLDLPTLQRLPLLRRRHLQDAGDQLFSRQVPASHLPLTEMRTSGSTGEAVMILTTQVGKLFWLALTLREHQWWQRDYQRTLVALRGNLSQARVSQDNWGPPVSLVSPSGPAHAISMARGSANLLDDLQEIAPHYLLLHPTALQDLLRALPADGTALDSVRQIRCIGETLSDTLRVQTRERLGIEIVDCYSSQEVGVIALQCPVSGGYHLMAEHLIVEVLDEHGRPCREGEIGEVVISDLHNFATPLLRYALGDHAEVGGPCPCGRNLPTLRRILGRTRNMLRYPDGKRRWPFGFDPLRQVAPMIRQFQLVQHSVERLELRLVVVEPLQPSHCEALRAVIHQALEHPFALDFSYYEGRIPSGSQGKFEEFLCLIAD